MVASWTKSTRRTRTMRTLLCTAFGKFSGTFLSSMNPCFGRKWSFGRSPSLLRAWPRLWAAARRVSSRQPLQAPCLFANAHSLRVRTAWHRRRRLHFCHTRRCVSLLREARASRGRRFSKRCVRRSCRSSDRRSWLQSRTRTTRNAWARRYSWRSCVRHI